MLRAALATGLLASTAFLSAAEAQRWEAQSRAGWTPAYQQCLDNQRQRQVAGAVIGGVLGAVIAAEVADDDDDHRHRRHVRHDRRHDSWGRGYRRDRHWRDPYWHDRRYGHNRWRYDRRGYRSDLDGDDVAVVAGLGLGAVAGAAIAGGGDCDRYLRQHAGHRQVDHRYAGGGYGYDYNDGAGAVFRGDDRWARSDDDQWSEPFNDDYRDWEYSDDRLAGAPSDARLYDAEPINPPQPRVFEARSQAAGPTGLCRYMSAGEGRRTLMCEGEDGIWRPRD